MAVYLITGTNRGIGVELVRQALAQGHEVIATAREPQSVTALTDLADQHEALTLLPLDLGSESSITALAAQLGDRPVDVLINNAGVYGPRDADFGNLRTEDWLQVLNINLVAPVLLTQALMPNLLLGTEKRIAFMSSKMGSIGDNGSGGSYI